MTEKERLFESFGELLYVVAMADGVIQPEEVNAIKDILKDHPLAETVQWSFDFELKKQRPIEELYNKVINNCHKNGPDADYVFFIEAMQKVAESAEGTSKEENSIIKGFSKDLTDRFRRDLEIGLK